MSRRGMVTGLPSFGKSSVTDAEVIASGCRRAYVHIVNALGCKPSQEVRQQLMSATKHLNAMMAIAFRQGAKPL